MYIQHNNDIWMRSNKSVIYKLKYLFLEVVILNLFVYFTEHKNIFY